MAKTFTRAIQNKKWSDGGRVSVKTRNRLDEEHNQKRMMRNINPSTMDISAFVEDDDWEDDEYDSVE